MDGYTIELTSSQRQFKNSSVAFLAVIFITSLAYTVARVIRNLKVAKEGTQEPEIPKILDSVIKVVEHEMAPSFLAYGIAITFGAFYAIMAILGYVLIGVEVVLILAYLRDNNKLIQFARVGNVALTLLCFIVMFSDDLVFKDAFH